VFTLKSGWKPMAYGPSNSHPARNTTNQRRPLSASVEDRARHTQKHTTALHAPHSPVSVKPSGTLQLSSSSIPNTLPSLAERFSMTCVPSQLFWASLVLYFTLLQCIVSVTPSLCLLTLGDMEAKVSAIFDHFFAIQYQDL
jgi:hypothetical protein